MRGGLSIRTGLVASRRAARVTRCVAPAAPAARRATTAVAAPALRAATAVATPALRATDPHAAVRYPLRHRTTTSAVNEPTAIGNRMSSIGVTPRQEPMQHPPCRRRRPIPPWLGRLKFRQHRRPGPKQGTCVRASLRATPTFCDRRRPLDSWRRDRRNQRRTVVCCPSGVSRTSTPSVASSSRSASEVA